MLLTNALVAMDQYAGDPEVSNWLIVQQPLEVHAWLCPCMSLEGPSSVRWALLAS